jgi:hypothetical protein
MTEGRPVDLLVAADDQMCDRLQHCTPCGRTPVVWGGIWFGVDDAKAHSIAYALCHRCLTNDPQRRALDALLRRRYGFAAREPASTVRSEGRSGRR